MTGNYKILFLFLGMSLIFKAQKEPEFSFDRFLDHVSESNPLSLQANSIYSISVYNYRASRGAFDPQMNAAIENKYLDGKNYYTVLNSELKQPLFTSQYLKVGYDVGTGDLINPQSTTYNSGLPYAGVEVALLQGMMIDKRRADVLKEKEKMNYFLADKNMRLNELFFQASLTYAEWSFDQKQLKLFSYFIELASNRYQGLVELANIGERAGIDSIEAAINYRSRLLEQQTALIDYQKKTAILNQYYPIFSDSLSSKQFYSADSLDRLFTRFKQRAEQDLTNLKIKNPVIEQYESKNKILAIEKKYRKEMIKPKLDIKYNFLAGQNSSDAAILSTNNYKWGAGLSFPLFLTTPRNNYKVSNLALMNNKLELEFKNRELDNKITFIKESLLVLNSQINNASSNIELSKKLLEAEKLKFYNGESSLFLVNARENKWMEFELKCNEFKLKYIQTVLILVYLQGNLNYKP